MNYAMAMLHLLIHVFGVKLVSILILIYKLANKNNAGYHIIYLSYFMNEFTM